MSVARYLAIAALLVIASPRPAQSAATIVVNTTADEDLNNATCSLREAIVAANTNASYRGCAATGAAVNDQIIFNLGAGTPTINIPDTPLPPITQWVTIDGGAERVELRGPGGSQRSGYHGLAVTNTGFGTVIRNLVINGFPDDGIFINADQVWIFGCFIGMDVAGTTAVQNSGYGVHVFAGNGARIGGAKPGSACTGDCNLISGAADQKANVLLDQQTTGVLVRGNFIGPDVTGTAIIPHESSRGIIDKGGFNRIGGQVGTTPGGACTGDCNLISGHYTAGGGSTAVHIDQVATGSVIQGNFIGTDVTGNNILRNAYGIQTDAMGTTIGGTTPGARNVMSGNFESAIRIGGLSTVVQGNYIGTNSAGTATFPSNGGITVAQADGAIIGGTESGAGNLISGITIDCAVNVRGSTNARIRGNVIGTAADGVTPLQNTFDGVCISNMSSNNTVGGQIAGAGNVIANNRLNGVRVDGMQPQVRSNTVSANSIYANGEAGIALVNNANDNLAPPTITGIAPLRGTACAPCSVEIFSDSEDEGRIFEGAVFTNSGNWTFNEPVSGPNVTATNTDMSNNTSPFSAPVSLPTPTAAASASPSSTPTGAASTPTPEATETQAVTPSVALETQTPMATASPTPDAVCAGDCLGDNTVDVANLIVLVNIALGNVDASECAPGIPTGSPVDVAVILQAVNNALDGCPA